MLDDKLIQGISMNSIRVKKSTIPGARLFFSEVRQEDITDMTKFQPAYCFIGRSVSRQMLDQIRAENNLSNNYGAVFIPISLFGDINRRACQGIVGSERDSYIVRGLLPSDILLWSNRRNDDVGHEDGIVYASPEDFPGLVL